MEKVSRKKAGFLLCTLNLKKYTGEKRCKWYFSRPSFGFAVLCVQEMRVSPQERCFTALLGWSYAIHERKKGRTMHPEGKQKRQLWKIKQTRFLLCFFGGGQFSSSTVRKGASFFKKEKNLSDRDPTPTTRRCPKKANIDLFFSSSLSKRKTNFQFFEKKAASDVILFFFFPVCKMKVKFVPLDMLEKGVWTELDWEKRKKFIKIDLHSAFSSLRRNRLLYFLLLRRRQGEIRKKWKNGFSILPTSSSHISVILQLFSRLGINRIDACVEWMSLRTKRRTTQLFWRSFKSPRHRNGF